MGGDRKSELSLKELRRNGDVLAEYRLGATPKDDAPEDDSITCSFGNLKLNDFALFSSKNDFPSKVGLIGVDETGRLSVYQDCNRVFNYGPNLGDTFKWIPQNGQTVLSEIQHADGRIHRFNLMSNEWLVFDGQGRLESRQTAHVASFAVKGVAVDIAIAGPVTVDKLRLEYDKFRSVMEGNNLPFTSEEMASLARRFEVREGIRLDAYQDSKKIWTIGIGLNLEAPGARETLQSVGADYDEIWRRKNTDFPLQLTKQQADQLLELTMRKAVYECKQFYGIDSIDGKTIFDKMPKNVQRALVDLMFNMGPESMSKFTTFNTLIRKGSYKEAGNSLMKTKYASDVGPTRSGENRDLLLQS